ncbi:MAG TPA: PilX N-terminal domain-containing pilus assembly protein [Gammaproteobacteria bacterium]|nr:PilX N-terminal domain-containing pilus assembly protein [Gammaproteobacteria bacterium]
MPSDIRTTPRGQRQRGVALIITMVVLLVLMVLGVMASDTSTLQYRMTEHSQGHEQAFEGAEAALAAARANLLLGSLCPTFGGSGCYPENPPGNTPRWQTIDWSSSTATLAYTGTLLRDPPRYFVEKLPPSPAPGQNLSRPTYGNVPPVQFFQVTAEGTSDGTPGQVILQSDFRP